MGNKIFGGQAQYSGEKVEIFYISLMKGSVTNAFSQRWRNREVELRTLHHIGL